MITVNVSRRVEILTGSGYSLSKSGKSFWRRAEKVFDCYPSAFVFFVDADFKLSAKDNNPHKKRWIKNAALSNEGLRLGCVDWSTDSFCGYCLRCGEFFGDDGELCYDCLLLELPVCEACRKPIASKNRYEDFLKRGHDVSKNLNWHHVDYGYNITIPLCSSCHRHTHQNLKTPGLNQWKTDKSKTQADEDKGKVEEDPPYYQPLLFSKSKVCEIKRKIRKST